MIVTIRSNEVIIDDGYDKISIGINKVYRNGERLYKISPLLASLVPDDHICKVSAERLASEGINA
jgi:hypothetical protein